MHDHVARAYSNLISDALKARNYGLAETRLAEGLVYSRERDLDRATQYQLAMRARMRLEQGAWPDAAEDAQAVLSAGQSVARIDAVIVLASLRVRQGGPDARILLDEARDLALAAGEIQRIAPLAAVGAEAAWLQDDKRQMCEELKAACDLALKYPEPWRLGELSLWLWRAGALEQMPDGIAEPYRLEIEGAWQAAAAAWEIIGCPYERALALAAGDHDAQLQALDILIGLGAGPAATIVRRRLLSNGLRGIRRGPRAATRGNPLGLTDRQVEILNLLAENLSNKEIALRLHITPKTVDHHVVALLDKLGASSRKEAAAHPVALGLRSKHRESGTLT
jgi:DNA-binding CsgD family transcriptional regulator